MVLETLIGLGMYTSLLSNAHTVYADVRPAHRIELSDYGVARGPFELKVHDSMPGARIDEITEVVLPGEWYHRT